ncbi:MAG: methylmalonyl Co-A mutase-associated GTPase MeaB [Bacteroidales bacterium]|jgi:LAO/AO transport system kinase|nr:methylmalonyl Co-A mutase-associated GTPase MeaB [Bacteroidales bacterium]
MKKNKKFDNISALNIVQGVQKPDIVNPYIDFSQLRQQPLQSVEDYMRHIRTGDRVGLSQAITLIESNLQEHSTLSQQLIEACIPFAGKSIRIGITGMPGAGKSTFIEIFGKYLTKMGRKLAVLAIDPSSGRSKGSILGDKTRMEELAADQNAFIRPSPSAGTLGGVARKTAETLIVCEAAGFDTIIIETVGVGQSETEVKNMVDFFLLLTLAGAGDELQGIKRGIMEMADAILINKADGDNIARAELAKTQINNALHLFPPLPSQWTPKTMTVSAQQNKGIQEVWLMIDDYVNFTKKSNYFAKNRIEQSKERFHQYIRDTLYEKILSAPDIQAKIHSLEKQIQQQTMSVYAAGREILEAWKNGVN